MTWLRHDRSCSVENDKMQADAFTAPNGASHMP